MDRSSSAFRLLPKAMRVTKVVIALTALGCVWGCGREGAQPSETPAERPTALRLAYGKKIHYAPQIIALKQGYFADAGLAIDAKAVQAGIQAAEALTSGSADVAVMGDAPGIIAAASGMPVKIVAAYGGGENMHRIVAAPKSGIRSAADLKGKRVGIQMGSSTHGGLLLFLEKNGLSADDLKLIPLNPSDMPEAMLTNQIDAGVGSEPWPSNIEERVEGSYEVATLSRLGNNYPLVMLVTERYAQEHPEAVLATLRATKKAVDFMHRSPDEAAELIAQATGVPVARERRIMDTLEWEVVLDDATVNSLKQTADFLHSQSKISTLPDWDKVIDPSFVQPMNEAG
ncbi:MAG: aliphatic sulfonate ABC transporter substrate-binding protein [Armatimonadota bacterium]|nr:MAG: aliphatic sulfonate ABC transporter substrate-binding protein [Armatimonadota bacterium]